MTTSKDRVAGLDVVRALAVLSVVAAHSFGILKPLFGLPYIGNVLSFVGDHIRPFAGLGVELFFALSGFLIGNILIRSFMQADRFTYGHVKHFWIRRWFRTLPNYLLILIANIVLYAALHLQSPDVRQLLFFPFLQNLVHPIPVDFFVESWSLSVEEWFYLTLPIVLLVSSAIVAPVNKGKFLFRVFFGYLALFVLIRCVNAAAPLNGPDQDNGIRKVVLFRLDAVMYGVLFAWLSTFRQHALIRWRKALLCVSVAGGAVIYFLVSKRDLHITDSSEPVVRYLSNSLLFVFQPLFMACCLPYANSVMSIANKPVRHFSAFISRISYSLYLVHYSLVFLPFFYPYTAGSSPAAIGFYLLYWFVVISLSALIYRYFEVPVMNLRDRFRSPAAHRL